MEIEMQKDAGEYPVFKRTLLWIALVYTSNLGKDPLFRLRNKGRKEEGKGYDRP